MNTKLLLEKSLSVIDQYLNFSVGTAQCAVPYYNNRHIGLKGALRANVGKGSPKDIFDEVESMAVVNKIDLKNINSEGLKKLLIDHNIGIDCSGLAYYILNSESEALSKGSLDRHLSFPFSKGILGKIRSKMRPVENAGVTTFASDENSRTIAVKDAQPGDIITLLGGPEDGERDHILTIHQIEYQNFIPTIIHYTHAVAWPTDGEYGHGVRQATIEILDPSKPITEQRWIEAEKTGNENYTFARSEKSRTEIRRLNWL